MKTVVVIFFAIINIACYAQAKLGITATHLFSPNDTVGWGTPISLHVFVKNKGNATFIGKVDVKGKVDTISGVSCGVDSLSTNTTILPGDSVAATITFTPTSGLGGFNRVNCCGNVIVVWPYSANAVTLDSNRFTLYITSTTGIRERIENPFIIYPNPAKTTINIQQHSMAKFEKTVIYDAYARKIKEGSFSDVIDISDLSVGTYWFIITTTDNKVYKQQFMKD